MNRGKLLFTLLPPRLLVPVLAIMVCLISALIFTFWYPQGIEDLLINQEWKAVKYQPTKFPALGKIGNERMKTTSVTFLGVGKNVAHRLPIFLPQVDELAQYFNYSQAVFVEGDSDDGSNELLKKWALLSPRNRSIVTVSNKNDLDTIGPFKGLKMPREGRLTFARNAGLQEIHRLPKTEYIIMIDMDIIGWNIFGVQDSFGRPSWDVICSNGIILHGMYRDTYAFRSKGINTNHHLGGSDHSLYNITARQRLKNRQIVRTAKQHTRGMMDTNSGDKMFMKPFEVESCFGGLAIYRTDAIGDCKYRYRETNPPYMLDCEHVFFHQCLRANNHARIFSNPHMKLWYGHAVLEKVRWSDVLPWLFAA